MAGLLGGLGGDAGLLAAAAAAVFLLYTAITMMARRKKKREIGETTTSAISTSSEHFIDFVWQGRNFHSLLPNFYGFCSLFLQSYC